METEWVPEAVVQDFEHVSLHAADAVAAVGAVGDEDKVVDLRGIHLLVLAGNEHGCHSDQLELRLVALLQLWNISVWVEEHTHVITTPPQT